MDTPLDEPLKNKIGIYNKNALPLRGLRLNSMTKYKLTTQQ